MNRRHFIATTTTLLAAPALQIHAEEPQAVLDVNFSLGEWPTRDVPAVDVPGLRRRGISHAITGSLEAVLHRDLAAVNERLATACAASGGVLLPAGCLNPLLPAWQEDLRRCVEEHGMKVLRLLPACHGYTLESPAFRECLDAVTKYGLALQIVAQMEDVRTQNPLLQLPPVDLKPLPALLKAAPQARVMVLNANSAMITTALRGCNSLWLDCAMIEGVGGLENTLQMWPVDKLCLGTHAPFFYPEAALLKMQESGLSGEKAAQIAERNARAFLG